MSCSLTPFHPKHSSLPPTISESQQQQQQQQSQQQQQQQQSQQQQQQSSELIPDESIVPPVFSQEEDDAFMSGEEAPDGVVQSTVDSPRLSPTGEQLKVPSNGHIKYGEPYTHCITHYHTCFVWFILIACLVVASYLFPALVTFDRYLGEHAVTLNL